MFITIRLRAQRAESNPSSLLVSLASRAPFAPPAPDLLRQEAGGFFRFTP
jgi:hypothetical protein